jgi:hypothetical protein
MVYSYKSLTEDQIILIGKIFLCVYQGDLTSPSENMREKWRHDRECKVRDILFKYGFYNIWISQYVNHVDFFMCEFKQRMKDNFNFIGEMNTFFNESHNI